MKNIFRHLFPKNLWNRRFTIAWAGCFATVLAFDLLWSMATSFRGLGFVQTYLYGAVLALLMGAPAMLRGHGLAALGAVLATADLLALANLMYGRTYFMPIPPASYLLAGNVAEFGDAITHSLQWADLVFPLITVLTLWLIRKGRPQRAWKAWGATLGCGCLLCGVTAMFGRAPLAHIEYLKGECYYRATPPVVYTLPVSVLADLMESNRPVSDEERNSALRFLGEQLRLAGEERPSVAPRRNLVMIIVESLESWPLGARVEGQEITPALNRLLADSAGVWFAPRVLSQVGPGRSIDGQLLMTAGLRPMADFVFSMRFPEATYPHIAKALKLSGGTKSYLLSGDRATTWNQGAIARRFDIDETRFRDSWDASESFGHPRNPSDGSFLRQVADKMKAGEIWPEGENAFVEIITYSSHFPFTIPEEHRRIRLKESYPDHLAEYITAINYTDGALGDFIGYLRSRPDYPETVIAIAGDHEALATWRDAIRGYSPEMNALVDADSYVPLIVLNAPVSGKRDRVMGQVDVYPTLLDMMGALPADTRGDTAADTSFPGVGFSALRSVSPAYATDISGHVAGDTTRADPAVLQRVLGAPAASAAIIRADLLSPMHRDSSR